MRDFATQICVAVKNGRLNEPFGPDDVRQAALVGPNAPIPISYRSTRSGNRAKHPSYFKGSDRAYTALFLGCI